MAFAKYAYANIIKPDINIPVWDKVRDSAQALGSAFATRGASAISIKEYSPKDHLFTHCTIVASVDTENGPGQLGRHLENGFTVDRRFQDYYITPNTTKFVNSNCVVPGTMILMGDGTERPVEDVQVGDYVITHMGALREVTETFKHTFKGYLRRVTRLGDTRPLEITAEHPVWAMTPPTTCACGCGSPLKRRHYKAACNRFKDFRRGHHVRRNPPPGFGWVSTGLLQKGDLLSYPRLNGVVEDPGITPGLAKLVGYFLAEGFYYRQKPSRVSKHLAQVLSDGPDQSFPVAVCFALHEDERDTLAKSIQELLMQEFGLDSFVGKVNVADDGKGIYVQSGLSIEAVKFFQEYCGERSHHKRVSFTVLQWPLDLQKLLVQGYLEGDGCVQTTAGGWLVVTSASADLISQMAVIFARLGVFATRALRMTSGRKRVREANGSVKIVNDFSKTCTSGVLQIGSAHSAALIQGSFLEDAYRFATERNKKHTLGYRVTEGATIFPVRSCERVWYEGPVYNFETEVDHSYVANGVAVHNSDAWERKLLLASFRTFIGGFNYLEHLQIPEMSKGRIVDACARDIGDSVYIDILVATERKHKPLIAAINSKQLQTLSMGANVAHTQCSKCGNVAADETELCAHIKYEKGNTFLDILGQQHVIAELCGNVAEPGSNKFIEASWVGNPAFKGAVVRNILTAEEASFYDHLHADRVQVAFATLPQWPLKTHFGKAARRAFDFAEEKEQFPGGAEGAPKDQTGEAAEGEGQSEGEAEGVPKAAPPEPPQDSLETAVNDLAKSLTERAVQKVRKDMGRGGPGNNVDENHSNNNLIPASASPLRQRLAHAVQRLLGDPQKARLVTQGLLLHRQGGWRAVKASNRFSGCDVLAISRVLDLLQGTPSVAGTARIYRTVLAVGGAASHVDVETYLTACGRVLGREPTQSEKLALITKGRLYDLGT